MSTVILRPVGAGNKQNWYAEGGDYRRVDEVVSDGDTTRLYTPTDDLVATFEMEDHSSEIGEINSVTAYINTRALDPVDQAIQLALRTDETDYFSPDQTYNNTSYHEESYEWAINPDTSNDWTWDEIDSLEIGMKRISGGGQAVTQVWMVVDYTESTPDPEPELEAVESASNQSTATTRLYRIEVFKKDGAAVGEIINFNGISFDKKLNDYGTCAISLSLLEPHLDSLISLRNYEVKIYRMDTLVWAGEQALLNGTINKTDAELLTLTCFDYLEQFNNRFTDSVDAYSSIDAGQIAWSLIDDSQNLTDGDFGITQGNIATTMDRDRTYYNQNIMEAIINLSNVENGFDFEITDNKEFNVYSSKGVDRSSVAVFEYGFNMDNIFIEENFSNPINEGIALGKGFSESQLRETYTDTSIRAINKLRQGITSNPDVSISATLIDKAEVLTIKNKVPIRNIRFNSVYGTSPSFGDILLGDTVKIVINRGVFDINNKHRVYGYKVSVDQTGKEIIEYLVSLYL